MLQFTNKNGKIEIAVLGLMLILGGSVFRSSPPRDRVAAPAAAYDTSYTGGFSCAGYDGCPSSGLVKLKFTPKAGAHLVRWQDIINGNSPVPTRIGTLTNVDIYRFPPLDLAAGGTAGLFIGQIGMDRGFGIYKLDSQGRRVGQPWWTRKGADITYCEPTTPDPTPGGRTNAAIHIKDTAHEMGWNCGPLAPRAQSSSNAPVTQLVSSLRKSQGLNKLWISCSGGCCDVGPM